jgi:hypothetical protein
LSLPRLGVRFADLLPQLRAQAVSLSGNGIGHMRGNGNPVNFAIGPTLQELGE